MATRFREPRERVERFSGSTLVVCPQCFGCALSIDLGGRDPPGWFNPRRLTCTRCPYNRDWSERGIARALRYGIDDYFGLPLWLQTPCCGDVLWVYNKEHLEQLEQYTSAALRERRRSPEFGWANRSYFSRLPRWVKIAKNRTEVARAIRKLRSRLPSARV